MSQSRLLLVVCLAMLPLSAVAQGHGKGADTAAVPGKGDNKVSIKPYGFVRNYMVLDSRKTVTVCGEEYNIIPRDEAWNITETQASADDNVLPEGATARYDANAVPQMHLLALTSRFGVALSGQGLFGATSNGRLEADFAGSGTNNTLLRLRLAYVQLRWDDAKGAQSLLVGQDWHPLSGSIMPDAIGMAAGSPFRPHSRTPQVRYELSRGLLQLTAAALWQFQYTSPGPNGESTEYSRQGLLPELFVGIGLRNDLFYAQLGADFTSMLVREKLSALPDGTATTYPYLFEGRVNGLSPTLYFQYTPGLFSLKMRSTLAQNLGHMNMMSGYARTVETADPSTWHYKPLRSSTTYLDIAYGRRWRANLLLGYHKNFGLEEGFAIADDAIYVKKGITNINSIYRIAPSISYNAAAFSIGLEYEWTAVTYGDLQSDGTVADNDNLHQVSNHRLCAMVKYSF